jgi:hypothetical protein
MRRWTRYRPLTPSCLSSSHFPRRDLLDELDFKLTLASPLSSPGSINQIVISDPGSSPLISTTAETPDDEVDIGNTTHSSPCDRVVTSKTGRLMLLIMRLIES